MEDNTDNTDNTGIQAKQEIGEQDEPPPNSITSISNWICRMVDCSTQNSCPSQWGENPSIYAGIGRRTFGLGRSIQFPVSSNLPR